jgi:hypothetical protein
MRDCLSRPLPESSDDEGSTFAHVVDQLDVEPLVRFERDPSLVKAMRHEKSLVNREDVVETTRSGACRVLLEPRKNILHPA